MANYFCLLLAAGKGARFGDEQPKQYTVLANGKTILENSLDTFATSLPHAHLTLLINKEDKLLSSLKLRQKFNLVYGGAMRALSVLNGLISLENLAREDDWILVHDVARCLLHSDDLLNLIATLKNDNLGGILANPITDTIKQSSNKLVADSTLDRNLLWAAQTPQMFRYGVLYASLKDALAKNLEITDEASCLELKGYKPRLIEANHENFKITYKKDVILANFVLANRSKR